MSKGCYLSTYDLHRLDLACVELRRWCDSFDEPCGVYLVGSAGERPDFRDVDVRLILADPVFDRMFGHSKDLWSLFCYAVSSQLRSETGLPVDFQVQRMTEANEEHSKPRNAMGMTARGARTFAGGGDATRFGQPEPLKHPRDIAEALQLTEEQRHAVEDKLHADMEAIRAAERAPLPTGLIGDAGAPRFHGPNSNCAYPGCAAVESPEVSA